LLLFNLLKIVSRCRRTLRGEGHSVAGWHISGSVIAADCGVQSQAMGCHYLRCAT